MFTFEIDGEQYVPYNNKLYRIEEEVSELADVSSDGMFLHRDTVGTFQEGESFSSYDWKFIPHTNSDTEGYYYVTSKDGRLGELFMDNAFSLTALTPQEIHECPNCGSWAGEKDGPIHCIECGYKE